MWASLCILCKQFNVILYMPRTGRPPIDPKDVRKVFPLRLNAQERKEVEDAAQRDGQLAATWARETLLRATKSRSRKD